MRYPKGQKEETRRRILEEAKRLFRESGAESIGVGELMQGLGLTHGGFYAHFKSKDALVGEACFEIFLETASSLVKHGPIDQYVCAGHRDDPAHGCAMPTMAAEVARSSEEVRHAFTHGFKAWLEAVGPTLAAEPDRRLPMVSAMVGAVLLSRAVDDRALSDRLLRETAAFLKER